MHSSTSPKQLLCAQGVHPFPRQHTHIHTHTHTHTQHIISVRHSCLPWLCLAEHTAPLPTHACLWQRLQLFAHSLRNNQVKCISHTLKLKTTPCHAPNCASLLRGVYLTLLNTKRVTNQLGCSCLPVVYSKEFTAELLATFFTVQLQPQSYVGV